MNKLYLNANIVKEVLIHKVIKYIKKCVLLINLLSRWIKVLQENLRFLKKIMIIILRKIDIKHLIQIRIENNKRKFLGKHPKEIIIIVKVKFHNNKKFKIKIFLIFLKKKFLIKENIKNQKHLFLYHKVLRLKKLPWIMNKN